ncbi:MAG TPA: monofunctional biosynthetic peptidoglycan transglycosylase [Vicinamibacterales bacterium]|nr:monofunctional biosynthetic peptidoglycan transglycosylase [Vicinamibacterales bacterium]
MGRKAVRTFGRRVAVVAAVGFGYLSYVYLTLPDVRALKTTNPATTAFIELRGREAVAEGKKPRRVQQWLSYRKISPNLTRAVLVAEDDAFWQHEGLDLRQLEESLEVNWVSGSFVRGGSTITQQLAKNLYLSPSKNPVRKLKELIIARRLEAELDKARILELYLNVIEWGDGIYGAEAAARAYFGSNAASLGPSQSALLAGAIINPRVLNPAHPSVRLRRRQEIILRRMGSITPPVPDVQAAPIVDAALPQGQPLEGVVAPGDPDATSPAAAQTGEPSPAEPDANAPASPEQPDEVR